MQHTYINSSPYEALVDQSISVFVYYILRWQSRLCSYGSWIYNYLWNQCLSLLTLWIRIRLRRGVLDTTLCDEVCQWLATCRWFSPGSLLSSTNKADRHYMTEILLKVGLSTIVSCGHLMVFIDILCNYFLSL